MSNISSFIEKPRYPKGFLLNSESLTYKPTAEVNTAVGTVIHSWNYTPVSNNSLLILDTTLKFYCHSGGAMRAAWYINGTWTGNNCLFSSGYNSGIRNIHISGSDSYVNNSLNTLSMQLKVTYRSGDGSSAAVIAANEDNYIRVKEIQL